MMEKVSRRGVLIGGSAAAAGAALATTLHSSRADAQINPDLMSLNALLRGEYGAIAAYDAGAAILMSPPSGDPAASIAPAALAVAARFQSQHRDHAAKLASMITAMGGTPIQASEVTFTAPNGFTPGVVNVVKLACNAEKGAAIAYAEVLKTMSSQTSAEVIAAIGGVETQHFIVLYLLANGIVAPSAMAMVPDIVPQSFTVRLGTGTTGLEDVADFTY